MKDQADESIVNGEVVDEPTAGHGIAVADDVLPDTLHVLPISTRPYFPGQVQPVLVNLETWGSTLKAVAREGHGLLGLCFVGSIESSRW